MKNNKTAKGIVSFATIILLLSFILALTLAYESTITANAVKEVSIDAKPISIPIKEVDNIKELNQLNEGWYQVINGYVYYLESFDSYIFLYIKVKNPDEAAVLKMLLENVKDAGWKKRIQARLSQIAR